MKVKELIQFLSSKDQEADVFFMFNGMFQSGDRLSPTGVNDTEFYEQEYSSDLELEEGILRRQKAVYIFSDREEYYPFR